MKRKAGILNSRPLVVVGDDKGSSTKDDISLQLLELPGGRSPSSLPQSPSVLSTLLHINTHFYKLSLADGHLQWTLLLLEGF